MAQPTENVPVVAFGHDPKGNHAVTRQRWLQDNVVDVLSRPSTNRVTVSTNATAINCNGFGQSSGIGCGPILPKKYAELWVKARATFNLSGAGALYVYVYRTTGAIPACGAAPNAGDVAVAGDAFAGPATVGGLNMTGSLSFIDQGLNQNQKYSYYFVVNGTNGLIANLINASQLMVSEF
jgi:hypothetical protein